MHSLTYERFGVVRRIVDEVVTQLANQWGNRGRYSAGNPREGFVSYTGPQNRVSPCTGSDKAIAYPLFIKARILKQE
jgi:hypothetical protein